jgi:glucose/mannose-6-phosphate isomerase
VLARAGVLDDAWVDGEVSAAAEQVRRRLDAVAAAGEAGRPAGDLADDPARLARRIGRRFPVVYGIGALGAAAAERVRSSVNVHAKAPAFVGVLPEVAHGQLAGFGQHGDVTRQVLVSLVLRHDAEPPVAASLVAPMTEILVEVTGDVYELRARGAGRLAQLLDLAVVGELVGLDLAAQEGLDPGPAPVLDVTGTRER